LLKSVWKKEKGKIQTIQKQEKIIIIVGATKTGLQLPVMGLSSMTTQQSTLAI
jgi:tRNA A37 N6-isopentenylltransferase MiaA